MFSVTDASMFFFLNMLLVISERENVIKVQPC